MPKQAPSVAVHKAFNLLTELANAETSLSIDDLTERTGMGGVTVRRLVEQLQEIDIVEPDLGSERCVVGPAAQDLAIKFLRAATGRLGIRRVMVDLVDEVQESCNLAVVCGSEVLYIDRVECNWPFRVQYDVGSRLPTYCTAAGKLMLAYMPAKRREEFVSRLVLRRHTETTITDPHDLLAECEEIRKVGVSIYNEEFHRGEIGVAVPVRNADGVVIAALAVHAPIFRMSVLAARTVEPQLHAAAKTLGALLSPD